MDIDVNKLEVVHNADAKRFEIVLGEHIALIEYEIRDGDLALTHTEVPPAFEGKGIAGKLAQYALDYARDNAHIVQPECPYIAKYVQRHPEYHAITRGFGA